MKITRFKKPELTISLTPGGTLAASTTYYLVGYFDSLIGGYSVYYGASSPLSDVYSFTTDTTNKSISVDWWTSGSIDSYTDGTGTTIVNSTTHCLQTGDEISIDSGFYSGTTHTMTVIDYDTFSIPVSYSGDTTGTTWKCEMLANDARAFKCWMHTVYPLTSDGTWYTSTFNQPFSHLPYYDGYTTTPVAIDAPFSNKATPYSIPQFNGLFDKSYYYIFEAGSPAIVGDETTLSLSDLNDEFVAAGLYPSCRASNVDLQYFGFLEFENATNELENISVACAFGSFNAPSLTLKEGCVLIQRPLQNHTYAQYIARNTILAVPYPKLLRYTATAYSDTTFNAQMLYRQILLSNSDIYEDITMFGNGSFMNTANPSIGILRNSTLYNTSIYYSIGGTLPVAGFRNLQNVSLLRNGDLTYDIVIYYTGTYTQEFENINTDREDNLKECQMNTAAGEVDVVFYRSGNIYLEDSISGATVTITASGDTYNYTSDSGGTITFDVVEQYSYPRLNIQNDNVVTDFTINIVKEGYDTYNTTIRLAEDIVDMYISLTPNNDNKNIIYGSTLYGTTLT